MRMVIYISIAIILLVGFQAVFLQHVPVVEENFDAVTWNANVDLSGVVMPTGGGNGINTGFSLYDMANLGTLTTYNPNNIDKVFHANIDNYNALSTQGFYKPAWKQQPAFDDNGNSIVIQLAEGQPLATYFTPGSHQFGYHTYVPNYSDATYFSSTTGQPSWSNVDPAKDNSNTMSITGSSKWNNTWGN